MTMLANALQLKGIPLRHVSALRTKAEALGISAEEYVKQLIKEDLELDRIAKETSFAQLSRPFQESLGHSSGDELDALVAKAKKSRRRRAARRR